MTIKGGESAEEEGRGEDRRNRFLPLPLKT